MRAKYQKNKRRKHMKDKKKVIPIYDVCFMEDNKTKKRYERYSKLFNRRKKVQ